MITDKILDIVFNIAMSVMDKLPVMDMDVDFSVLNTFLDAIGFALYFFPWQKVLPILGLIVMLQVWRVLVSIVRTIWDVLPLA